MYYQVQRVSNPAATTAAKIDEGIFKDLDPALGLPKRAPHVAEVIAKLQRDSLLSIAEELTDNVIDRGEEITKSRQMSILRESMKILKERYNDDPDVQSVVVTFLFAPIIFSFFIFIIHSHLDFSSSTHDSSLPYSYYYSCSCSLYSP